MSLLIQQQRKSRNFLQVKMLENDILKLKQIQRIIIQVH